MPNNFDATGLRVASLTEIEAALVADAKTIYGSDINVDQNSPDGQMIGAHAQADADLGELLFDMYSMMSVENASGTVLRGLVAINGMSAGGATYTTTYVSITATQALSLVGLDALIATPNALVFQVKDTAGNPWNLVSSYSFGAAGTASLLFQAASIGAAQVTVNTITAQQTVVLGVSVVNNPTVVGTTQGVNEESDPQLKIRRAKMFYLASIAPADAVQAALLNLTGMADASVFENDGGTSVGVIPAHSIYCVVNGTSSAAAIANAIYKTKAPGCGMYGSVSQVITRANGQSFTAKWDAAVSQRLYVRFAITAKFSGETFDTTLIATKLAAALPYKLGQSPNTNDVIVAMNAIAPDAVLSTVNVSANGSNWYNVIAPTALLNYFTLAAGDITIS